MRLIETESAPKPAGHYSQAVVINNLVFVAGLLPVIPNTNKEIPEGIIAQTEQVFKNLQAILIAAGSALSQLVSIQIFIPDMELWEAVDKICTLTLNTHKPARTIVPCGHLRNGALIEANAVAAVPPLT